MVEEINFRNFPTTRYQGSKRKLLPWLYKHIAPLKFKSVLDIFGGTGIVSYLFKKMDKKVTFNDYLKANYFTGRALIENDHVILNDSDIAFLLTKHNSITYNTFVKDTFKGIYYTNKENAWIDMFLCNWNNLDNKYPAKIAKHKKAIAFHAFSQSALKKRPFNLFHRANLNLRLSDVKRSFGNKTTWDGLFNKYFSSFVKETNNAIFNNKNRNRSLNLRHSDFKTNGHYDLVYIDPPYVRPCINKKETGFINSNYLNFYHFLEGASDSKAWGNRIDYNTNNLRIKETDSNEWVSAKENIVAFEKLFRTFRKSIIVISYKEPGIPSKRKLLNLLKRYKKRVISVPGIQYHYALNKNNGFHKEYLLIGRS